MARTKQTRAAKDIPELDDRLDWFAAFDELPQQPKSVMMALSMLPFGIDRTDFLDCFPIKPEQTEPPLLSRSEASKALAYLQEHHWLEQRDEHIACPAFAAEELTLCAAERNDSLYDIVRAHIKLQYLTRATFSKTLQFQIIYTEARLSLYERYPIQCLSLCDQLALLDRELFVHSHPIADAFFFVIDIEWFLSLAPELVYVGLAHMLGFDLTHGHMGEEGRALLALYIAEHDASTDTDLPSALLRLEAIDQILQHGYTPDPSAHHSFPQILETALAGEPQALFSLFPVYMSFFARLPLHIYAPHEEYLLATMSLLWCKHQNEATEYKALATQLDSLSDTLVYFAGLAKLLLVAERVASKQDRTEDTWLLLQQEHTLSTIGEWTRGCVLSWISEREHLDASALNIQHTLKREAEDLKQRGYHYLSQEILAIAERLTLASGSSTPAQHEQPTQGIGAIGHLGKAQQWQEALTQLTTLIHTPITAPKEVVRKEGDERLIWLLGFEEQDVVFTPKVQRWNRQGKWTSGRQIPLKKLKEDARWATYLAPDDFPVLAHLRWEHEYGRYGSGDVSIDTERMLMAMVDFPRVFLADDPMLRVECRIEQPIVHVAKGKEAFVLRILPEGRWGQSLVWIRETETHICLYPLTSRHHELRSVFGPRGMQVPLEAKSQLEAQLQVLSEQVIVVSDAGGSSSRVRDADADPRPVFSLAPFRGGCSVSCLIWPLGEGGPVFRPGQGDASVFVCQGDAYLHTQRDHQRERELTLQVLELCHLAVPDETEDMWLWQLPTPDQALPVLVALQRLAHDKQVTVVWPEGKALQLHDEVSSNELTVEVQTVEQWFHVSGELRINERLVLSLQQVLLSLQKGERFIVLDDGSFVLLTEALHEQLSMLQSTTIRGPDGERRLHLSGALGLSAWMNAFPHLEADDQWHAWCARLEADASTPPAVPSALCGELRHYQQEGFAWLAQLAEWGFGACLADEMGLGKTIQAIALLLQRVDEGPALVVAPKTVAANWQSELHKFAPSLQCHTLDIAPDQRDTLIDSVGNGDVVLCSYGLLPYVAEQLVGKTWGTAVLDEAHAIKNAQTRRAAIAHDLTAGFRLATTGTPVENRLSELWSLFQFLNPGLLGSKHHFQQTFSAPIEQHRDTSTSQQLKKLVQPFILRRKKEDVLTELPPRTESILYVELSEEERALYEAVRQNAMTSLNEDAEGSESAGQRRFQLLAELMRLRLACCAPALVVPESDIPSTKHEQLLELLDTLLAEGEHQVLLFSQFVKHLNLVEARLKEAGINYLMLTGKTSAAKRKRLIKRFQEGECPVFLISLKAGGVGINLTAADYVVLLDPWWNPAVEDQASDRAHRMGQTRPVTIYRMVTRETIEERIVQLHETKRALATSLLEDADGTGALSADELLSLIREPFDTPGEV